MPMEGEVNVQNRLSNLVIDNVVLSATSVATVYQCSADTVNPSFR